MSGPIHGGRCLLVGIGGPDWTALEAARVREIQPAGLVLFRRNLATPERTRALVAHFRTLVPEPSIVAIDQEGGRVSRLEPWIGATPTAASLAQLGPDASRRFAAATGRALRALGVQLDFAPVVDLSEPDAPNGIGARSYGTDPEQVTRHAREFLLGLAGERVAGCLKHFPGLGDTCVDSHHVLPVVQRDRSALEQDLRPYRELGSIAPLVMVGHGHYPALDPTPSRPASCSPAIVRELLRGSLAFRGVVASDDLEMGAVAARDADGTAAVEALDAGCDLLLYCSDLSRAERARAAIEREPALEPRLREAVERIGRFARAFPADAGAGENPADWAAACLAFAPFRTLA